MFAGRAQLLTALLRVARQPTKCACLLRQRQSLVERAREEKLPQVDRMRKKAKLLPSVYLMYPKKELYPMVRSALASLGFNLEALISLFPIRFWPDIGLQYMSNAKE